MRSKWVPAPPPTQKTEATLTAVRAAQRAIPLIPKREAVCLQRLQSRAREAGIENEDDARQWLLFLRSVGLISKTPSGYRRTRSEPDATQLFENLCEQIYGARELQDALQATDKPLASSAAWNRAAVTMPTWERHHHGSRWEEIHQQRGHRLCEWFVLLGGATQCTADNGEVRYRSATS